MKNYIIAILLIFIQLIVRGNTIDLGTITELQTEKRIDSYHLTGSTPAVFVYFTLTEETTVDISTSGQTMVINRTVGGSYNFQNTNSNKYRLNLKLEQGTYFAYIVMPVDSATSLDKLYLNGTFSFTSSRYMPPQLPSPAEYAARLNTFPLTADNYITVSKPQVEKKSVSWDSNEEIIDVQYFDGLGRLAQTVQKNMTPLHNDLITMSGYDYFGRSSENWLPSPLQSNNGRYANPQTVKEAARSFYNDTVPYYRPQYEPSPLNRVLQQFGPGADWHTKNKAVTTEYLANTPSGTFPCDLFEVTSDGKLKRTSTYPKNSLYVTKTTDEDGNTSYEFKDKLGQVVLTRQVNEGVNYDTYYVFDDFGKPRFVLPPMASVQFTANGTWDLDNQTLKDYAYIYKYDEWLRCTWKKIPGCEPIYYVYDRADRLILSQDGEQRKTGSWTFNKYDALGRVVITGVHTSEHSHESWINLCKDLIVTESKGGNYGYTWNSLPEIPFTGTLLVNHYDDYEHLLSQDQAFRDKLSYTAEVDYGTRYDNSSCASCSAKGLLVGTRTRVMDGGGEIVTAIYYDSRGRVVQTKSTNLLGGTEAEYTAYDFTGHPTKRKHVHTTSSTTTTELYAYTYDHAGRLLKTTHSLNGGAAVTLAENTYDESGRLKTNKPASNESLKLSYEYNVRSWLTNIAGQKFTERLYYNIPFESGTPRYNGNISTAMWNLWDYYLGFNYTYDNLSRLTAGESFLRWEGDAPGTDYGAYDTWYRYDRNGNMTALSRLEDLSLEEVGISHSGNQISRITNMGDLYPDYYSSFVSYSDGSAYAYNANGAMTSDPDKGARYVYNLFGMPSQVKVPAILGTIDYKYSATGERLEASYKWHSGLSLDPQENLNRPTYTATNSSKLRQYAGNKVYENGSLKRILLDNGYIEGGIYYFYLRDHLGNNSVVAKANGQVVQRNHYYPYGKVIGNGESWGQAAQPYKFGGKEEETMFGLELYDFHARQMDRRIPGFLTVDPLAEIYYSISPYAYCLGNPVKYIDPTGMSTVGADGLTNEEWMAKTSPNPGSVNNYLLRLQPDSYISPTFAKYINSGNYGYQVDDEYYQSEAGVTYNSKELWVYTGAFRKSLKAKLGLPDWMSKANDGINAFGFANSAKTELMDYAVRSKFKSARTWSQFNKLKPAQQAWRTTNALGKTGAKYLAGSKLLGNTAAALTTAYSAAKTYDYYFNRGGSDWTVLAKTGLDVVMTGVGFLGPIGFGVSTAYYILDAGTDGFGGFGKIE